MELIQKNNVENEIRNILNSQSINKIIGEHPTMTSNGYEIYYNDANGEAVGIVCENVVFLKYTSPRQLSYKDALKYCKSFVINGVQGKILPYVGSIENKFGLEKCGLKEALAEINAEINAENLVERIWAVKRGLFCEETIFNLIHGEYRCPDEAYEWYVMPVLILKR